MSASLAAYVQVSCVLTQYVVCQYPTMYGFSGMPQIIPYESTFQQTQYYDSSFQSQHRHKHKRKSKKKKGHRRHATRRAQSNSESSSRSTESENDSSEECTCDLTCGQCAADNSPSCCITFCSTCIASQNMNQGVLFVPYPYPIVVTNGQQYEPQQDMTKNETLDKENNNNTESSDKPKNVIPNESEDKTHVQTQDETQDGTQYEPPDGTQDKTHDGTQDGTQDTTQDVNQDGTQDKAPDVNQDGTQNVNQDKSQDKTQDGTQDGSQDKTQNVNQGESKNKPVTGGRRKLNYKFVPPLKKKVKSITETKNIKQIKTKQKITANLENGENKAKTDFIGSKNITNLSDDVFNDIIFKVPNKNNTKYVMTSIRRINENWLPKYGIVPIPEKVASDLMAKLRGMKTIQPFRETRRMTDIEVPKNSIYSSETFHSTKTVIPSQDNSSLPNKIQTILVRDSGSGLTIEGPKSAIQKFNRRLLESMQIENELQKFTGKEYNSEALPIELVKKIYQY